jgi:hypothetical protein
MKHNNKIRQYYKKLVSTIRQFVITEIAKMRMRVGIKAVQALHKYQAKKYLNPDYKTLRQYIVLLERPVRKKKYYLKREGMKIMLMYKTGNFTIEERLFWINKKNFKKIRRAGWLPKAMKIEALKEKAFYVSSLERTYQEHYKAKQHAITKYITYLKSK